MKTLFKKSLFVLLLTFIAVLTLGLGSKVKAEASSLTLVPNKATTGNSSTSYVQSAHTFNSGDVSYVINNWNPSTLQVRGNQTASSNLQSGKNFYIHNTTEFPGSITSITITYTAGTLVAGKVYAQVGSSVITNQTTSSTAGTAGTKSVTWNFTGDNKYFAIGMVKGGTSSTTNIGSIVIEYDLPATDHQCTFESVWSYDDKAHWYSCTDPECSQTNNYAEHSGGTIGYEKAICEVCNQPYGEVYVTLEEALEIASSQEHNQYTLNNYYVEGTIKTITEVSTQYGNATFTITDGTNEITCYRAKYLNNTSFTDANQINVGDVVVVYGGLGQYNDNPQIGSGYLVEHEVPELPDVDPSISEFIQWEKGTNASLNLSWSSQTEELAESGYVAVENVASLKDGDQVLIGCVEGNSVLSSSNANNDIRTYDTVTIENNMLNITEDDNYSVITLVKNGENWLLQVDDNKYLCITSDGNKLYTKELTNKDDTAYQWNIIIENGVTYIVSVKYNERRIQFNNADGQQRYAAYKGTQKEVTIYKLSESIENYQINEVAIRFGAVISAELYEKLAALEVTFGVNIKSNGVDHNFVCTPVRVNENGEVDAEGEYYQFAVVINGIPEEVWGTQEFNATCYVQSGEDIYLMRNSSEYSVVSLLKYYLDNSLSLNLNSELMSNLYNAAK